MKAIKKIINLLFLLCLALFIISWFQVEKLPKGKDIVQTSFKEPIQSRTAAENFTISQNGFQADIDPLYEYELWGLIVEDYSANSWFDYMHKRYDPFNTKDICVIWGDNVRDDKYANIEFSHGEFTCYFQAKSRQAYADFDPDQLSNNHLVPASGEIAKRITKAKVGDQIYLKGYLTNNRITLPDGRQSSRHSSTVRSDAGNGACEVIYVNEFQVQKSGNRFWSWLNKIGQYGSIMSFLAVIVLFAAEIQMSFNKYNRLTKAIK